VPPRDVDRLSAGISALLACPDTRRFGVAGREVASRQFSVAVMRERTAKVFLRAVGPHTLQPTG
jgi:hypothetical protein